MKKIINFICIGLFSSILYCGIEILYRNFTHWTMGLLAFIVGILLSIINDEILEYDDWYEVQILIGTSFCIVMEGLFGIIFNSNYNIWDYRNLPFTFCGGQLNLIFCGVWMIIVALGLPLLDWLQYKLQAGPRPYYKSYFIEKFFK